MGLLLLSALMFGGGAAVTSAQEEGEGGSAGSPYLTGLLAGASVSSDAVFSSSFDAEGSLGITVSQGTVTLFPFPGVRVALTSGDAVLISGDGDIGVNFNVLAGEIGVTIGGGTPELVSTSIAIAFKPGVSPEITPLEREIIECPETVTC